MKDDFVKKKRMESDKQTKKQSRQCWIKIKNNKKYIKINGR